MAERRMFAKTIIDSDAFLDMPLSTQALYFHLSMRADDDGFINNCKKIQRMIGASDDDLKLLMAKRFIIPFESGVVVIKHWKIHNYIQSDRYKETVYLEEKSQLELKDNKAYTLKCIHDGYSLDTQDSIEIELDQNNIYIDEQSDGLIHDRRSGLVATVIGYLNERTGSNYRTSSQKTKKLIEARFNEGFSVDDFKKVIDNKSAEWMNTDMQKYLRPETLFGTKFESYLNQKTIAPKSKFKNFDERDHDWDDLDKLYNQ